MARTDPDTQRWMREVKDIASFFTSRRAFRVHLKDRHGHTFCGLFAPTSVPLAELPPCPEEGFCVACCNKVIGGRPVVARWHKRNTRKDT